MKLKEIVEPYKDSSPLTITIVSPFVSEEFIKTVVEEFSPNKMLVVADKRSELEIDKIAKVEVRLAVRLEEDKEVDKLVHAKLFLFDWKNGAKVFVWGSANATLAALGTEPNNAECISSYKIRDSDNEPESEIELYFKQLWQNVSVTIKSVTIKSCDAELGAVKLSLPEFSLGKRQDSFDKWLEEGKLFDPDKYKTTLTESVETVRLSIPLKKDINTKNIAEQHDFDCSETKTLSYNKFQDVPNVDLPSIKDYAVNTVYGYWMPDQIYIWFKEESKSEIREAMGSKIEALIKYIETNMEKLIDIFMEHLNDLVKDKQVEGSLKIYFQDGYLLDDNELDITSIREKLEVQLKAHIKKCCELRDQVLEVHDLFPIRFSLGQWDNFALSFVKSVRKPEKSKHGLSRAFIEQTTVKKAKQGKMRSNKEQWSLSTMAAVNWDTTDSQKILQQLRKVDWSVCRESIHNVMKLELQKKLSEPRKKAITSDTEQS